MLSRLIIAKGLISNQGFERLSVASDTSVTCGTRYSNTAAGSSSYYVSNCQFISFYYSTNGSAVNIYGSSCNLDVNYSYFMNCSTASYGGAISFIGGTFNATNVCAYLCSATLYGDFSSSMSTGSTVLDCISVCKCPNISTSHDSFPIFFGTGTIEIERFNFSDNHVTNYGASFSFQAITVGSAKFGSIANSSDETGIIDLYTASAICQVFYTNIVNNTSYSIFHSTMNLIVSYCIIKANNVSYIFESCGNNFSAFDCFMDSSGSISSGNVKVVMNHQVSTNTLEIGKVACYTKSTIFTFISNLKYTDAFFFLATYFLG